MKLLFFSERKLTLDLASKELLYHKKINNQWVLKERFTKKDVSQLNLEGKDRDRLNFKFTSGPNNAVLFKFKSRDTTEEWLRTLRCLWKVNEKPAGVSKSMLLASSTL